MNLCCISDDFSGFFIISMIFCWFLCVFVWFCWISLIFVDFYVFSVILLNFFDFCWISCFLYDFCDFLAIQSDRPWNRGSPIPRYSTLFHAIPRYSTLFHAIPRPWNSIPRYSTLFHAFTWFSSVAVFCHFLRFFSILRFGDSVSIFWVVHWIWPVLHKVCGLLCISVKFKRWGRSFGSGCWHFRLSIRFWARYWTIKGKRSEFWWFLMQKSLNHKEMVWNTVK